MTLPALDPDGLLPAGVHNASLEEVGKRFGCFVETERRVQLQDALVRFAAEARETGLVAALVVNGSFTTGKAQPEDIDIIVVLRQGVDFAMDFKPHEYNVLSARRVKRRYPFDVRYATQESGTLEPMIAFFAEVKGRPGLRKGMVKVTL
jgi:hypothetical protein